MKIARKTAKYSLLAAGFLITLGAFLVIAAGMAYLSAGVNAQTVEKYLSDQIQRPVRVDSIETRWSGFKVEVEAHGIRILRQDGGRRALRLRKLEITFDPLTLLRPDPGLERIVVYGLSLRVLRQEDGTIRVGDFVTDPRQSPNPALEWLLNQPSSEIRETSLVWKDQLEPDRSLSFSDIDMAIDNTGGTMRFSGSAVPPRILGESVGIKGEIQGQLLRSGLWDGRIEIDLGRLQLAELPLIVRQELPWQTAGFVSAHIETEWLDGHIIEAAGNLELSDFEIPFEGGEKIIPVNRFTSAVSWRHDLKNWRLEFVDPGIDVGGSELRTRRLVVGRTNQTRTYHVDTLELAQLLGVRDQLQFELPWHEVVAHIKPDGRLNGVSVATRGQFLSPDHWRVEAGFEGIGWQPFSGIPGVTGAKGSMAVEPEAGEVRVDASGVKFDMPGILAESIYFNEFGGKVRWARDAVNWDVEVSDLALSNSDMQGLRGRAKLSVPIDGTGLPRIDSQFSIAELEVDKLRRYLPTGKISPKAATWLDAGLLQGSFHNARIELAGDLAKFPFRSGGGSFYVSSKVLDGRLHYADNWPDADGIFGYINLNNAALHADIASAAISGSRVIKAVVESADLFRRGAEVDISARLASPAKDVIEFLTSGPLIRNRNPLTLEASGGGSLDLDIHLPLGNLKNGVEVAGQYDIRNAELTVVDRFSFQDVKGVIEFTDSTVGGAGISASLLGGPLTLDIDTTEAGKPPSWKIDAQGQIDAALLAPLLQSGAVSENVSGHTRWSGTLRVEKGAAQLNITSDLKGAEISLPEPLAKTPDVGRETILEARFGRGSQAFRFESGPLTGVLVYDRDGPLPVIRNGVVAIGKSGPGEPPAEGIRVDIQQPFLNLDKWMAALNPSESEGTSSPGAFQSALRSVELELDDVRFLSRNLGRTNARAISTDGVQWSAWVSGDHLRGQVEASLNRGEPDDLRMDFDRLYLPKPRGNPRSVDPDARRRYPNVEVHADHFIFGEWDLGSLDLKATSYVGRWSVDQLTLDQPGLQISANGHWAYGESGSTTRIRAGMRSEDIGIALEKLSLPPHIADSKATLDFALEWPGEPQGFVLSKLDGTYSAIAESGIFLNVDPGSGRLLGLFNVDAISRRLSLDFSDIFSKGLAFDHIKSEGVIADGNLYSDGMFISGPSALIEIDGRIGLAEEDYDLRVVVAPHVGSQISMISALANPVAGAMVFIAQKVFEKQLAKMIQYQYDITGSWDAPEFTTIRWEPELVEETTR